MAGRLGKEDDTLRLQSWTIAQVILASESLSKMSQLKKGLYDQLITRSVRDALEEQNGSGVNASIDELEESDGPDYLDVTLYRGSNDFLFPSIRNNGQVPVWPDILLKKVIRPAVERAGITGKTVGWHTFRHSLGTNLRFLGIDIKTAQELLRHANSRITLDLYTQRSRLKSGRQMQSWSICFCLLRSLSTIQHHRNLRKKRSRL